MKVQLQCGLKLLSLSSGKYANGMFIIYYNDELAKYTQGDKTATALLHRQVLLISALSPILNAIFLCICFLSYFPGIRILLCVCSAFPLLEG